MLSLMQRLFYRSNTGTAGVCSLEENTMTLENKIENLILEATQLGPDTRFDVVAHELWGNKREGYETNSSWFLTKDADMAETLEAARGRWEVFKVNYHSKARVSDIQDIGCDCDLSLEVDCIPFLEIRPSR